MDTVRVGSFDSSSSSPSSTPLYISASTKGRKPLLLSMDIFFYWIFIWPLLVLLVNGSECQFPAEWRGQWHEGRRTEISINSFSRKGTCIQMDREHGKYFMLNKDSSNRKCFRCLVITQWHMNLLQYKERLKQDKQRRTWTEISPCWYKESFKHVCSFITGDTILHTLVRAPSPPQPCPFQGSYTFSYVNSTKTNLQCDSPVSELRACADESKFKFIFKRCAGVPGTHDAVRDFQCLAIWESGDKYLYGSFSQPWMKSVDEYRYRCFMHSFYGTNGEMSMSADSTCIGLQSPTLGAISMKFVKDMNEPRGRCQFPDVLVNRNNWRDLSGRWRLEVEDGLQVLRLKDRLPGNAVMYADGSNPGAGVATTSRLVIRCVDKTYEAESVRSDVLQTDYLTYYTDDECESAYQCVRLVRRDTNILEMYLGDRFNSSTSTCKEAHFAQSTKYLLIPDVDDAGQCSITRKGIYTYTDKASDCTGTVNIGCQTPNKIVVDTKCPSQEANVKHTEKLEILHCLHSWSTDSKTYIIIQNTGESAKCLTFTNTEFGVELQSDDSCQSDRWTVTNQYLNYLLYSPPDTCVDTEIQADQNVGAGKQINDPTSISSRAILNPTVVVTLVLLRCFLVSR